MHEKDGEDQLDWSLKNQEILKEPKNRQINVNARKRNKVNGIVYICRGNCLLKYVIWRNIGKRKEVKGRGRRRGKQLLDNLKERRGYCELNKQTLDRTLWKIGFDR
jgi:hypothetical protein